MKRLWSYLYYRRDQEYSSQAPSDSDNSQHSQPFEMVDRDDLHDATDDDAPGDGLDDHREEGSGDEGQE